MFSLESGSTTGGLSNAEDGRTLRGSSLRLLSTVGATQARSQQTGDIAVWSYTGNMSGPGIGDAGNIAGNPAHAGIFIVANSAGQGQYLNRVPPTFPVTVSTDAQIQSTYQGIVERNQAAGFSLPGITSTPTFYRR